MLMNCSRKLHKTFILIESLVIVIKFQRAVRVVRFVLKCFYVGFKKENKHLNYIVFEREEICF